MVLYCAVFTNIRGYLFGYFKPIAQNVYGDSALWFLIADANGLSGNSDLAVGQALNIPSRVSSASGANTFTPYNASKVIGDTSPNLPQPVAQAQGGGGGGCGGLGTILMIAIIVVVTIYTAGAATAALSTTLSGAAAGTAGAAATAAATAAGASVGATMTLGATALAGGAGMAGLAGAMIGAAVGNIAGQAFAVGTGMQKDFNWNQVGLSALTAGITAGVGSYFGPVTNATPWYNVAGRAALSTGLSQGIGDQLGMGVKFSWTNVAMAAVSSGVNSAVQAKTPFNIRENGVFNDTMNGFATGMTMNALRGGQMTPAQVATDAFGNALGNSIVESIQVSQQEKVKQQALASFASRGEEYIYDNLRKSGVSEEKLAEIRADKSLNGRLGEIAKFAKAQQHLIDQGTSFESLSPQEQVKVLNGTNIGETLHAETFPPLPSDPPPYVANNSVAPPEVPVAVLPELIVVAGVNQTSAKEKVIGYLADGLKTTGQTINDLVSYVGPDNAAAAVFGIQAAVGGLPRAVAAWTIDKVTSAPKEIISNALAGPIFDVLNSNELDPQGQENAKIVADALAGFGAETIVGNAVGVVKKAQPLGLSAETMRKQFSKAYDTWAASKGGAYLFRKGLDERHHVLPFSDKGAIEARTKMERLGLDYNDPRINGIALPKNADIERMYPTGKVDHRSTQNPDYVRYVNRLVLDARDANDVVRRLDYLRNELITGKTPWKP